MGHCDANKDKLLQKKEALECIEKSGAPAAEKKKIKEAVEATDFKGGLNVY